MRANCSEAGVPTDLHVYPGAFHGFDMVATAQVSILERQRYIYAVRRVLYVPPTAISHTAASDAFVHMARESDYNLQIREA